MREPVGVIRGETDQFQQLPDDRPMITGHIVHLQRLGDGGPDRHPWIEGGVRVLKHDLHLGAKLTHLFPTQRRDLLAAEPDRARGRLQKPEDAAARPSTFPSPTPRPAPGSHRDRG